MGFHRLWKYADKREELLILDVSIIFAVLTWSVYHLAKNKDVQKKLHKKLHSVKSLDVMPHTLTDIK